MSRKLLFLILIVVFPTMLFAQNLCEVSGEYTYYAPDYVSREEARAIAIEGAKVQALADKFGTLVGQYSTTMMKNANGESSSSYLTLGESSVKGEWIADTKAPKCEERVEDGFFMVTAHVWGEAREIVSAPIDIKAKVLRNGTSDRYEDTRFRSGDTIRLSFKSPAKGYLAVYLMDDKGDAYCILPYTGDDDGMFPVKPNKDYILFSEKYANKDEQCDEYVMTCDKPIEQDLIYVIFSPKKFVKARDNESRTTVKVGDETLKLPRQLSFRDFQKWLLNCRRVDEDMQVVIEPISITRE